MQCSEKTKPAAELGSSFSMMLAPPLKPTWSLLGASLLFLAGSRINKVLHTNYGLPCEDPLSIFSRALSKLHSIWLRVAYPFASIGRNVSFHFTSRVSRQRAPRISIGNTVVFGAHAWLNSATDDPTGDPTIVIDDDCVIAVGAIISAKNRIHLERAVNVAQQVLIMDHNHAYEDIDVPIVRQGLTEGGRIRIGEGSWIGHGAAVLCSRGELTIGRHCVVAANCVVTRSIPDYSVVFGIPAKVVRQYDPQSRTWLVGQYRGIGAKAAEDMARFASARREPENPVGV